MSAVHIAAAFGHDSVVELLIFRGADTSITDKVCIHYNTLNMCKLYYPHEGYTV